MANNFYLAPEIYQGVPGADVATNLHLRDVVGNKTDAEVIVGADINSILAYIKGLLSLNTRAAGGSIDNNYVRDILGSKTDVQIEEISDTRGIIGYLKGLIQELDQRSVPHAVGALIANVNWADVVNINDKGVLTGISQYVDLQGAANQWGKIRLTIDGVLIFTDDNFCRTVLADVGGSMSSSLPFNHRFNTSLQVEHCGSAAQDVFTKVSYTTD